jgi:two-component sensor histidine kinase
LKQRALIVIYFIFFALTVVSAQNEVIEKSKSFQSRDSSIIFIENTFNESQAKQSYIDFVKITDHLVSLYIQKSEYKKAEKLLNKKIKQAKEKQLLLDEANAYMLMGNSYKKQREFPLALVYYQKANTIYSKEKYLAGIFDYHVSLIEFYRALYNQVEAQKQIGNASLYLNKVADPKLLIRFYNRVAAVKNETSKIDSSLYYSRLALRFCQKISDKNSAAVSYNEMGFSFANSGKLDSAEIYYKKAEEHWRSSGDDETMLHVMNNLGMLYGHNHKYYPQAKVASMYYDIVKTAESKNIDFSLRYPYQVLSMTNFAEGDSMAGLKYQLKYYLAEMDNIIKTHNIETSKIKEQYENELIKSDMLVVQNNLRESNKTIEQKTKINLLITVFLIALFGLTAVVVYLLTQRNKAYKILKKQNKEKDVLIQEIHHRVKNNLQFIAAMIKMQQNTIRIESGKKELNETSRRINAMSLVHEMLYNKDRLSYVSLKEYVAELVSKLKEMVHKDGNPIEIIQSIDDVKFNINNSVALGMITSEIISNAIKHAFLNTSNPTITILLKKDSEANFIVYQIGDNGLGIRPSENNKGLGTRLIDIFARQIEAEYIVKDTNGLEYEFKIPYVADDK